MYESVITKDYKPKFQALIQDIRDRRDKDFFRPTGTQVYVGKQGSGKTISAVKHVDDLKKKYPRSILVTNILFNSDHYSRVSLNDFLQNREAIESRYPFDDVHSYYVYFKSIDELGLALQKINNDRYGVIYLVDEIHTYFNALESKNIPTYIFTEISQQRKQRKLIIGTSQLFLRMAKPFREQCDNLIICRTRFGFITYQSAYDGMTLEQDRDGSLVGDIRKKGWFYHSKHVRGLFDTFQKVQSGSMEINEPEKLEKVTTFKEAKKSFKFKK